MVEQWGKGVALCWILLQAVNRPFFAQTSHFYFPAEHEPHEATWMQWPHGKQYGRSYKKKLEPTWVDITKALVKNEKVNLIHSGKRAKKKLIRLLLAARIDTSKIRFYNIPTNDVWVRDNGPIFVKDSTGKRFIEDWGFNGWGGDYRFRKCNAVPKKIASPDIIDLNQTMVLEGGAIETDGNGTILTTKSAVLNQLNAKKSKSIRNPGMSQRHADSIIHLYLGAKQVIWLEGMLDPDDITDGHIDGFARFGQHNTLFTMSEEDLSYWGVTAKDQEMLLNLKNASGQAFSIVNLPLTANNVFNRKGMDLGFRGSYLNFYTANGVVLVPVYNDPNDQKAIELLQMHFTDRAIIPIDCRNLIEYGGMVHCVTQQEPAKE